MKAGVLVLVVGPSGGGKDTLLAAAQAALFGDPRVRFVRRVITRAADAGGEVHESVTEEEFGARRFALSWRAHGLAYGIPADIEYDIAAGRIVVANVSRTIITEAAKRFPVHVIEVFAPAQLLARRLSTRGRENAADVVRRIARSVSLPATVPVYRVLNDATPAEGATRFLVALSRVMEIARRAETADQGPE
jgi:ribose 1,5-bisphosphokinase